MKIGAHETNIYDLKNQIESYEKLLTTKLTDTKNCPFPLCDGKGNLNGKSASHTTLKTCPNKSKNPLIEEFIRLNKCLKKLKKKLISKYKYL